MKRETPAHGPEFPFLIIELFVVIVVVFGAEFLTQALFHAAAPHGQIVPAADQQADKRGKGQTGADNLHHHPGGLAHGTLLLS